MSRPALYVLAGVNGAGKSSLGGQLLAQAGFSWYDPDAFAAEVIHTLQCSQAEANAIAWKEGLRRLDAAIAEQRAFALETTLGGQTIPQRLRQAAATHDILIWYCGLASVEKHLERIRARVTAGGHDIPAAKVRERWRRSAENLIGLMPNLAHLLVYDNSRDAIGGRLVEEPALVTEVVHGRCTFPVTAAEMRKTPEWAKPIVEAAFAAG